MQIWTPIWFVDLAVLILAAFSFADFKNKNGESIELKDTPVLNKIYDEVLLVLIVLVQLFLFLKVDNLINWNWFAVFSPWIAREVLMATKAAIGAFTAVPKPEAIITTSIAGDVPTAFEEKEAEKKRDIVLIRHLMKRASKVEALHNSIGHLLRVWLAIFLSLKLNNQNNWNWGLVLLPIWVHFAFNYAFVAYVFCGPVFLRYLSPYAKILMSMTTLCIWIPAFLARRLEVTLYEDYFHYLYFAKKVVKNI